MKILVGMSGGVDSTYAAHKLISEGHDVEGAVLIMHEYTETDAAEAAAADIGIKLHKIDCRKMFDCEVREYFINEYINARTPNPCVVCNSTVKFKYLLEFAESHGFDAMATGHYAKLLKLEENGENRYAVASADDSKKDQSYMLWRLPQNQLSKLMFPLSNMKKEEIREKSAILGISASDKRDSQEICFIANNDYPSYIESIKGKFPKGNYIDENGKVLGKHEGLIRYTIGQRKGLGVALGARAYVTDISVENNTVTLGMSPSLKSEFLVSNTVFSGMSEQAQGETVKAMVKIRYLAPKAPATVKFLGAGKLQVLLDKPEKSITPGQSAVFYQDDIVLFGGFID